MKRFIFLLCWVFLAGSAQAATYFVKTTGNDSNTCVQAQSAATPKLTINAALGCLGSSQGAGTGHIVEVWAGTYNEQIINVMPSGTSWNAPFQLKCKTGDRCIVRPTATAGAVLKIESELASGSSYFTLVGEENTTPGTNGFTFDGVNIVNFSGAGPGVVTIGGTFSDFRFVGNEVTNANVVGVPGDGTSNSLIYIGTVTRLEIRNNDIHTMATDNPGHGTYHQGHSLIYEKNKVHGIGGFGFHGYSGITGLVRSNNTIRFNEFYDIGSGRATVAGILETDSTGGRVHNNVVRDVHGSNNDGGIGIAIGGTGNVAHNNTVEGYTWQGISAAGSTGATLRNNISYTTLGTSTAAEQIMAGTSTTISKNLGRQAHANVEFVGNPLFTNTATGDLTLQPGSPAIDAGVVSVAACPAPFNCTYSAVFNGSLPDLGAYETIPLASASATTTGIIDITFGAAYAPLSTLSSCANVTVRQAAATKTCTGFANNGNATYRWTCAACLSSGGGTIDIAITAGKFTDSIKVGNTLNQSSFALPVTTVTNNISGTTEVFTSRHFRQRTFGRAVTDTVAPAWIKAEDAVGTVRVDGGKFSNWWLIDCTIANCPSVGFQFEFSLNGAGYAAVTDSCLTNAVCYDSTNSAAPHGAVISACLLTDSFGNCLAGAVAAQASSYPVLDLAINQSAPIQGNFAIKSGLVAGTDQICIRPKLDSGAAVTHAVTACVDVINPAGSPA